jgi:hypothetical protein
VNKVKVYKVGEKILNYYNGEKSLIGEQELAIIEANGTNIVIESDACHNFFKNEEEIKLGIATIKPNHISLFPDATVSPTIQWLKDSVESYETTFPEWIMYYKIKSRIIENCRLLANSLKENGLDPTEYFEEKA